MKYPNAKQMIFNAEMAKAIQEGRKTETRQPIILPKDFNPEQLESYLKSSGTEIPFKQRYKVGQTYWIREPAKILLSFTEELHFTYLSDNHSTSIPMPKRLLDNGWAPSWMDRGRGVPNGCIREMARTFVEVVDVQVEYLQDISDESCEDEGIYILGGEFLAGCDDYDDTYYSVSEPYVDKKTNEYVHDNYDEIVDAFVELWDNNAKKGYEWEDNPLVFVYKFKVLP